MSLDAIEPTSLDAIDESTTQLNPPNPSVSSGSGAATSSLGSDEITHSDAATQTALTAAANAAANLTAYDTSTTYVPITATQAQELGLPVGTTVAPESEV